jgi:hypothetical protein
VDTVVANSNLAARTPENYAAEPVRIDLGTREGSPHLVLADVVDDGNAHRHDPEKLTGVLMRLYEERSPARTPTVARSA